MDMDPNLQSDMLEATRLTGAGRLTEATALLQRMLQGKAVPSVANPPTGSERPTIDVIAESGEREGHASPRPASVPGDTPHSLIPAALRGFLDQASRGEFQLPGGLRFPSSTEPPTAVPEGAQFLAGTFGNQAGRRPYKLYVPSGYRGQAIPLIVMLHGCTQSPDDFAAGTRMNAVAEEQTCFVLYPEQTAAANLSRCWNWFSVADQQRGQGEPSLIAGITRKVMRDYSVDPERVYVAGLSAGAAAAAIMGMTYADLYAAIGIHSGLACGAASDQHSAFLAMREGTGGGQTSAGSPAKAGGGQIVPAIVFHGDRDTTVHPCNGDAVIAQSRRTVPLTIRMEQGRVPGGHAYSRTLYTKTNESTVLEQWVIHGAGHAWSGGSPAGSCTDPRGPDATREILRFFLDHPHSRGAAAP
jgi:poly(hydroxyalkanoate) depolymerase family esterase